MFKTPIARKIAIVILRFVLLTIALLFIVRAFITPIPNTGTREVTLVKVNGSTFCQSCMGLYQ